jgi:K+-sensing histidine kinase KdpD
MDPAMTSDARPGLEDRTDLIAQARADDAMLSPAGPGKLRTYLGIAPGVGKTYAMLRDARARRRSGTDTVVAHWERHARPATAAQLADLEVLPARVVTYQGASFAEPDVAALLDRRPELAVIDELAHANLPGERYAKRWRDVGELLANGIDVYTTLNVANIESLGALVSRITGVHPAEPVPDEFLRSGEIKLVDLAPAALRRRLIQGLVVPEGRWMQRCRAISASRILLPCVSSRSCGWMTLFPIQSRRSWLPAVSASRLCRTSGGNRMCRCATIGHD